MKEYKTVLSPADIMLPPYKAEDKRWTSYAVIACDQFTSEPVYWEKATEIAGEELTALDLILPEAYLETPAEAEHKAVVAKNMKSAEEKLGLFENCLVYVERTLADGAVRYGIVGKLDLEEYDFSPDSKSAVRATEETVVSRIPPRVAVRKEATIELPHVMIFANDEENELFAYLCENKSSMSLAYDFTLMLNGGSIKGYRIEGELLEKVMEKIYKYEKLGQKKGLVYAMGDGNHSLASAKAHFEAIKAEHLEAALDHPARYALVEMVNLYDSSIEFEPIYRILKGKGAQGIVDYVQSKKTGQEKLQSVTLVRGGEKEELEIPALHSLTVGSLQILIDEYLKTEKEVICDYIHGVDSLESLCKEEGTVGFLFDGVKKEELFDYVAENGTLPRKTFSMGSAYSKRYYIEARKIVK